MPEQPLGPDGRRAAAPGRPDPDPAAPGEPDLPAAPVDGTAARRRCAAESQSRSDHGCMKSTD
jgi:hypothetical protein